MPKKHRDKQTKKFLQWIQKYPGWWYLICTPGEEHITPDLIKLIVEKLAKNSFYEIIFVFLMVHREDKFLQNLPDYMLLDSLAANWEADSETILTELIARLE